MKQIDFTPQWYRVRTQSARDRKRRLGYLGVLCVLMIGWFMIDWGRAQIAQANLLSTQKDYDQAQDIQGKIDELHQEKRRLEGLIRRFESVASGIDKSIIFAEISHRIPDKVRLADFTMIRINSNQELNTGKSRRKFPGRGGLPVDVNYSDLKATITAQAIEFSDLKDFVLELEKASLFEKVDPKGTEEKIDSDLLVYEKKIDLYVYRKEHIEP